MRPVWFQSDTKMFAWESMKHPWAGCFVIQISGGRIIGHTPVTMKELEKRYGKAISS